MQSSNPATNNRPLSLPPLCSESKHLTPEAAMGEPMKDLARSIGQSAAQCQKHKSTSRASSWCVSSVGGSARHKATLLGGLLMPLTLRRGNMCYAAMGTYCSGRCREISFDLLLIAGVLLLAFVTLDDQFDIDRATP